MVRVAEMRESLKIIEQVAKNIPEGDYTIRDKNIVLPEKKDVYGNIEGLMNHFMLVIKGLRPPVGEIYDSPRPPTANSVLLGQRQQRSPVSPGQVRAVPSRSIQSFAKTDHRRLGGRRYFYLGAVRTSLPASWNWGVA